jgi:intergrase/recombinase
MSELAGEAPSPSWFDRVDVRGLGEDARRAILERVKGKLGFTKALEALGISRGALHNYLHGLRKVPDEVIRRALQHLEEREFNEVVQGLDRLRALGIVKDDGSIDYSLASQVLALAVRDEYLKQLMLRFAVENFREDLRRMLGVVPSSVKLAWDAGFEEFLMERKKRRKVASQGTLAYYRSLFKRYLEGRELSQGLIDYVISHENRWLRNVFRHHVQYLYHKRAISPEAYGWLMEVVPSRGYKLDVRPYLISMEDLTKTMLHLKENHELYYLVYRLMLEGGLRLSHALTLIEMFRPNEIVEVNGLNVDTPRLVCFEDRGFCRYYMGLREAVKPCEWIFFSMETLKPLEKYAGRSVARRLIEKYASGHGLLAPKYMRKAAWRLMIRSMPREVARFIQSRFGELKVSEARYEDLLAEADEYYPKYLERLSELDVAQRILPSLQVGSRSP